MQVPTEWRQPPCRMPLDVLPCERSLGLIGRTVTRIKERSKNCTIFVLFPARVVVQCCLRQVVSCDTVCVSTKDWSISLIHSLS